MFQGLSTVTTLARPSENSLKCKLFSEFQDFQKGYDECIKYSVLCYYLHDVYLKSAYRGHLFYFMRKLDSKTGN